MHLWPARPPLGEPELLFTTPAYDGLPFVMVRLAEVAGERLTELVTDAWRMWRR